jgi:beta-glucosidase
MKSTTRRGFLIGGTVAAAAVGAGLNGAAAYFDNVITRWWSGTFTKPVSKGGELKSAEDAKAASSNLSVQIEGEGAVLLKNDGFLPMQKGKVALLGYSSADPVYIGAGSVAQGDGSNELIDFPTAFDRDGFTVNQTMRDYYSDYLNSNSRSDSMDMQMLNGADYGIYDESVSSYRDKLDAAAADGGCAVVVFSRKGGEGGDLPIDMGSYKNGDPGQPYLRLQTNEKDLLSYAESHFDHVVVLLDSTNAMQLDFLDDAKIDAAIWIGAPGASGLLAIPQIMCGEICPSGHLVDTFPYDLTSNPTYYTCTAGTYNNYEDFDQTDKGYDNKVDGGMIWYNEGIYMGYRYYETAAADGVLDYDAAVQFPFGFGLSYTTFSWKVADSSIGGAGEKAEFKVEVTNTGSVAGKDVVELYFEPPYTLGGIEKSARVLGAFAKTSELEPGASETVTLTMDVDDLASYDYKGYGCYVAEAGTYRFHFQTDSHNDKDGVNPIAYEISSDRIYDETGVGKRSSDFVVAKNHFDIASAGDGNIGNTIPWMTREDLAGTHPKVTMGGKHITQMDIAMGDECVQKMLASEGGSDVSYEDDEDYVCQSLVPVAQGESNGLTCDDLAGYSEWDDPVWDKLVNEMSLEEMCTLVCDCGYGTPEIASIGKRLCTDIDGPAGISSQNLNYYGHEFCGEPVTAATWNTDLARQMGTCVGDEALAAGVNGWYAPGCDMHRTPFGGRCAEYYSEDPLLTGKICAAEISAVQAKGVYCYVKHFAFNFAARASLAPSSRAHASENSRW